MPEPASQHKRSVGQRLRLARLAAGFETARELAVLLGMEENTLTKWERGGSYPDPARLALLRQITQVTTDYLYIGDLSGVPLGTAQRIQALSAAPNNPGRRRGRVAG